MALKTQIFKSSINIEKDRASLSNRTQGSGNIELEPNTSSFVVIEFATEYKQPPSFMYSIMINDNEFELFHYIREITNKNVKLCVANKSDIARALVINYVIFPML
jgi:hypothetical protein